MGPVSTQPHSCVLCSEQNIWLLTHQCSALPGSVEASFNLEFFFWSVLSAAGLAPSVSSGFRNIPQSSSLGVPENSKCPAGEPDSVFSWKFGLVFMWCVWAWSLTGCCVWPGEGAGRERQAQTPGGSCVDGSGWGLGEGRVVEGEAQFYQPRYYLHSLIQALVLEGLQYTRHCTGHWGCHHFQQFSLYDPPDIVKLSQRDLSYLWTHYTRVVVASTNPILLHGELNI